MGQQATIPGTERSKKDKKLDAFTTEIKALSKKRKRASDAEVAKMEEAAKYMLEKGLTVYENVDHSPPLIITLNTLTKHKVKVKEDDSEPTNTESVEADDD